MNNVLYHFLSKTPQGINHNQIHCHGLQITLCKDPEKGIVYLKTKVYRTQKKNKNRKLRPRLDL